MQINNKARKDYSRITTTQPKYTHTINEELFATPAPVLYDQVVHASSTGPLLPASAFFPLSIKSDSLQRMLAWHPACASAKKLPSQSWIDTSNQLNLIGRLRSANLSK